MRDPAIAPTPGTNRPDPAPCGSHHAVCLGLGSNLGDREGALQAAVNRLADILTLTAISPLYASAAWGVSEQPAFLNCCLTGTTTLTPQALLAAVKQIEQEIGRKPSHRWGPREIDIDILLWDDLVLESADLTLPHPWLTARNFVLLPLADVAPAWVHPVYGERIADLAARISRNGLTRLPTTLTPAVTAPHPALDGLPLGQRTLIMGIINVTPDSFSGDGVAGESADFVARAVQQGRDFLAAGADILDVGGESTRPGSAAVDAATEQARVLPVIRALRALTTAPISIDTWRADTARRALAAGATWINDVQALAGDPDMAAVAAAARCPLILMHNGRNSRPRQERDDQAGGYYGYFHYDDLLAEVRAELQESIDRALAAGIARHRIVIDPGIGFGKTGEQNLTLINRLNELKALGCPILLGSSRKGFIGHVLGGLPAHDRLEGTAATVAIGIARGADIIRVHDLPAMVRVARMTDAIVRRGDN